MSKVDERKKLEQIAKNLLIKQQIYKNRYPKTDNISIIEPLNLDNNENKNSNFGKGTLKDFSLTKNQNINYFNKAEFNQINENKQNTIQNISNNQNYQIMNICGDCSIFKSVKISLTEYYYCCNNSKEGNNQDEDDGNIPLMDSNIKIKKNMNIIKEDQPIDLPLKKSDFFSFNQLLNAETNKEYFNKILAVYRRLVSEFSINYKNKKNFYTLCIVFASDYFRFLFGDKVFIFLKYFNNSIDVLKFIFCQIFIFLNLIYIDESKKLNEYQEMSFRTILKYSYQNYELLLNVIKKIEDPKEEKVVQSLRNKNNIIFSILNTLFPKKTIKNEIINTNSLGNEKIYIYQNVLQELEKEIKSNKSQSLKNNLFDKLVTFISNLKEDEELKKRFEEIEIKKEESIVNKNEVNSVHEIEINKKLENYHLKDFDEGRRYKFTIFIELDETLVHYCEEGNNYFVKVRLGTEDFIKTISEFCEIVIISTSSKEYTDTIIDNLNKDKVDIKYIYKELLEEENKEINFQDINRDLDKCIFICHSYDFFNAPKSNIVKLKEFLGEETDKEIIYIHLELMKLNINNVNDVHVMVENISEFIENKRL